MADLVSELVMFVVLTAAPAVWRRQPIRREFFRQMRHTAVRALPFVLVVGAIVGATALVRVIDLLKLSGSSDNLAPPLLLALLRDPAPVVVNLISYATTLGDWQLIIAMARTFGWSDAVAFLLRAALPAALAALIARRIGLGYEPSRGGIAGVLPGFFTLAIGALAVVTLLTMLLTL